MMFDKFDALCARLGINKSTQSDDDFIKLKKWCEDTLSTDCYFGDNLKSFESYKSLASGFLEDIQPHVQTDSVTTPSPLLNGNSPLQLMVEKGLDSYLRIIKPNPDQVNTPINGFTFLELAAARGHLHTVQTLLSLGAKLGEKSNEPILFSALMLPIIHDERMKQKKQSIYILLSKFAKNIETARNETGDNILHLMSIYGYEELITSTLRLRTELKKLAYICNSLGHFPIHSAILNGQHESVRRLITLDGIEQLADAKGRNALHYAVRHGDMEMITICLSYISINSVDKKNQTPLMMAVIANNLDAVKVLLDSNAKVNMVDDDNKNALHYAAESTPEGNEIKKLLIEKGAILGRSLAQSI